MLNLLPHSFLGSINLSSGAGFIFWGYCGPLILHIVNGTILDDRMHMNCFLQKPPFGFMCAGSKVKIEVASSLSTGPCCVPTFWHTQLILLKILYPWSLQFLLHLMFILFSLDHVSHLLQQCMRPPVASPGEPLPYECKLDTPCQFRCTP
jgi:hypothetical protein